MHCGQAGAREHAEVFRGGLQRARAARARDPRGGGGAVRTWLVPSNILTLSGLYGAVMASATAALGFAPAGTSLRARVGTRRRPCGFKIPSDIFPTISGNARLPAGRPAEWIGPTTRLPPENGSGAELLGGGPGTIVRKAFVWSAMNGSFMPTGGVFIQPSHRFSEKSVAD